MGNLVKAGETYADMLAALPIRRQRFVEALLGDVHGNGRAAALAAGYSAKCAARMSTRLRTLPEVRAAIDAGRAELLERTRYTADRAFEEYGKAMELAIKHENPNAYVQAVTGRAKVHGLLIERIDARVLVGDFRINVSGIDGGTDG